MTTGGATTTSFSPFVCACFTVNFIVGTGFLALPWAFERAGTLFSAILMSVLCVVANISSDFLLNTMARAEYMLSCRKSKMMASVLTNGSSNVDESSSSGEDGDNDDEEAVLLVNTSSASSGSTANVTPTSSEDENSPKRANNKYGHMIAKDYGATTTNNENSIGSNSNKTINTITTTTTPGLLIVKERKFELTELCQIFLGRIGFKIYAVSIILYIYGLLWAYTSVFGNAMAQSLPLSSLLGDDTDSYVWYVILFGVIVIPLSFLELSEQVELQVFLSGCRFLMIFLMIVTPLGAALTTTAAADDDDERYVFDEQSSPIGAPWFRSSGIGQMLPIVVFSTIFHQSIPGLAQEVSDKSQLGKVFGMTIAIVGVGYTIMAYLCAWYFGDTISSSANLNWDRYYGMSGAAPGGLLARVISFYVVCFPAIDVISAYPLNALVLAKSLLGIFFNESDAQHHPRNVNVFKFLASFPPILGALLERDLGTITDYTGLTGLAIAFCFPALLFIFSERKMKELSFPTTTVYKRWGSNATCAAIIFVFGVLSIVFVFVELVLGQEEGDGER